MTVDEKLASLRAKLSASEGQVGYADRVKALRDEIARVEAEEAEQEGGE